MPTIWDKQVEDPYVAHKMVLDAIEHLRRARDLLKSAGANRALMRVRSTLKSAEGAGRHAECRRARSQTHVNQEV
jgi:hypothetical protein